MPCNVGNSWSDAVVPFASAVDAPSWYDDGRDVVSTRSPHANGSVQPRSGEQIVDMEATQRAEVPRPQ